MLNTSKDLLYIILSISISFVTIFICWLFYYLISIIKDVREITDGVNDKVKKVDSIINKINEKIEKTSSNIGLLTEIAKRGISIFSNWKNNQDDSFFCKKSDKKNKK